MGKKNVFIFIFSITLLFVGCGDKKKDENSAKSDIVNKVAPAKIKVTKNVVKKDTTKEASKENSGQFYYSYNKEGKSKESKEIDKYNKKSFENPKTTVSAYSNVRSPAERIKYKQMMHKLSKNYIILCSACHSDYANGVIGPSLLGKNKEFIYQKIIDFKTGKKKNVLMKELVSQISDKELKNLANEIAKFNQEVKKIRSVK